MPEVALPGPSTIARSRFASFLRDRVSDPGDRLPAASLAALVAFVAWFAVGRADPDIQLLIGDVAIIPIIGITVILAFRTARDVAVDRATQRAWRWIGAAYVAYLAGAVAWSYLELVAREQPYPSIADAGFLAFYPLIIRGLLAFPSAPRTRSQAARFWIDVAMVVLAGGIVLWHAVLSPIVATTPGDPTELLLALAYPLADLVLLFGMASLILREVQDGSRSALSILVVGLIVFFASDLLFTATSLGGTFESGGWPDLGWFTSVVLVGIAARAQSLGARNTASAPREHGIIPGLGLLPYTAIAGAYGLLVLVGAGEIASPIGALIVGSVGLTALALVRQFLTLRENAVLIEERAKRRTEARFEALVRNSSDLVTVVGPDGRVVYESPSSEQILGYRPEELIGQGHAERVHPRDVPVAAAVFRDVMRSPGATASGEFRVRRRDGTWLYVEAVATNLLDDPDIGGIVSNTRDIQERKTLEAQLTHQALHDTLTNLANRALLHDRVAHALQRLARDAASVTVMFLDLDDFKRINDSAGHAAGDEVLCTVAARISQCLRPGDTAARFGGDEFAVLLSGDAGAEIALDVARRIGAAIREPMEVGGRPVRISACIGVASTRDGGRSAEALLRDADVAMYAAKGRGPGQIQFFEAALHAAVHDRLELETDLRDAVSGHHLELHYQPVVDLASGATVGAEALVRWRHPTRGLLMPASFVPLAEASGLIDEVGSWVLTEACREAASWQHERRLFVSVNISARQLEHEGLVTTVSDALAASGLAPDRLALELTESVLVADSPAVLTRLGELRARGVRIAVDDFGTGYSSLGYLQRFPIDTLKIDRSFVERLDTASEGAVLPGLILRVGEALGLEVIAEGVERESQRVALQALGCRLAQGYLFAKPLTPTAFTEFLTLT